MFSLLYFLQRTKTSDCIQQPDQQSRTDHFAQTYQQTRQLSLSRPPYSPDHFHVGMTTRPDHTYPQTTILQDQLIQGRVDSYGASSV